MKMDSSPMSVHSETSEQLTKYGMGDMSERLGRVFRAALYLLLLILIVAALAIYQRVSEQNEEAIIGWYYAGLSKLDGDLYRLDRDTLRALHTNRRDNIQSILAESESIWLDFDALLAQQEAESHIAPPVQLEKEQLTVVRLRTGLLESLLLLRDGKVADAIELYEKGPELYIQQLHDSLELVLQATVEHMEEHQGESARARLILITSYFVLLALTVLFFRHTLQQLGSVAIRLEQDLHKALDKVSRQQKLTTLGQVAGTVSHELRNPLGTIRSSVYSLGLLGQNKSPEARKILDRIERNILRCDAIVASLLDYMREFRLNRKPVNLLQWTLQLLSEQELPAGIKLQAPERDVGDIALDSELMRRAFLNVFNNAIQAITAVENNSERAIEGTLEISLISQEGQVGIVFKDNGSGISAENLDRVFEPLFSTRSFGIGLGMLIVRQIMEQHEGSVIVRSQLNAGTQVTLWLPTDR